MIFNKHLHCLIKIISILFIIIYTGCAIQTQNMLENMTKDEIASFAKENISSSNSILSRMKNPSSKGIYSDGRFSYIYSYSPPNNPLNAGSLQSKIATFIFSPDGILEKWKYDENFSLVQRSKFSSIIDIGNIDTRKSGEITKIQYEEISIGSQSGRIFGECGKPLYAYDEEENSERWIYRNADYDEIYYYFIFKEKKLQKKYSVKIIPYS